MAALEPAEVPEVALAEVAEVFEAPLVEVAEVAEVLEAPLAEPAEVAELAEPTELTSAHESTLSEPELLPLLVLLLPLLLLAAPWACKAAIRLCMNCWKAEAMVVASELEELPEDGLDVEAVDEVLLEDESVPVVLEELLTAPLDCRACMIASMSPPPGGGGGPLVELVELLSLLEPVDCVELK